VAGPDDPTVGPAFEERRIPPPPDAHGSLFYSSPYEPYTAGQQPGTRARRGRHLALIVGAFLLAALLIGGGLLAWQHSSAASTAAVAAATSTVRAQAAATASAGSQTFVAKGSATTLKSATTFVRQEGSNTVSGLTQQGTIQGGLAGSYTNEEVLTLSSENSGILSGRITCICTVAGRPGTLTWSYTGTQRADGNFQGQFFDLQGSGDLAALHGQGEFQGQGDHLTYRSELHFAA
jgi:hypothetical protein